MGSLADWFDPNSAGGILAVVFGFVIVLQALEFLTTVATTAPLTAVVGVVSLGLFVLFAWMAVQILTSADETDNGETTDERDALAVLKERYARGELSETEFERRLGTLLDTDEHVRIDSEAELERA